MRGKKHLAGREERPKPKDKKKASFGKRAVAAAEKEGIEVSESPLAEHDRQERLLADAEEGLPMTGIQGDKILVKFVKPHFQMVKDDRFVELEFSIALTDEHRDLMDEKILTAWDFIKENHLKSVIGVPVPPQTVDLYLSPSEKRELHLTGAEVTEAKLSLVERTGDGKTEKIMRLQFRVVSDPTKDVREFATTKYGNTIWLKMQPTQGVLAEAS
jgi:hypothetical protein